MLITVNVTQEDIEHGSRRNATDCPVARAVRRAFPGHRVCVVSKGVDIITRAITGIPIYYHASFPEEIERWIKKFDCYGYPPARKLFGIMTLRANLQPFSFNIEIPYSVEAEAALIVKEVEAKVDSPA